MAETARTESAPSLVRFGRERSAAWTLVTRGVHVPKGTDSIGWWRAWATVLPRGAAFTGLSAAAIQGWWLPPLPQELPVFAAQCRTRSRPQRRGLRIFRLAATPTVVSCDGIPVTNPVQTLLACARQVSLLDLVVLVDGALASGACTLEDLIALVDTAPGPDQSARQRRRGMPLLRRAVTLADERSESPWETLLRVLHVVCGIAVETQALLVTAENVRIRGDLRLVGTQTLHEYDGADHRTREGHRSDLMRDRRLIAAGWTRRGYTSHDLLHRAVAILREADDAIGRPHDPSRIRTWHRLLADSLFTPSGRAAFLGRHAIDAPVDWVLSGSGELVRPQARS